MRTKEDNEALVKQLAKTGFYDCEKVIVERDAANNVTGFGKVVHSPKAVHESAINDFNAQMHNSGFMLRKKGVDYELVDVVVAKGGGREFTRKMYVEAPKKAAPKKEAPNKEVKSKK